MNAGHAFGNIAVQFTTGRRQQLVTRAPMMVMLVLALVAGRPAGADQSIRNGERWEGFIDGILSAQRQSHHYAGAVVVIVEDGRVAFEKGYGFSDFAERKPVDSRRTLFRVGSNSKMFLWTAVMQLVEQGKLDLHADVNQYLHGIHVPATFPQPITLEHLMTHTPGFEDHVVGIFAKTPDRLRSLSEIVISDMPRRVFPPGTVTAYSNFGTLLAAHIVEQAADVDYEQYIEDRILSPLQMTHAAIRQPPPPAIAADLSKGYEWADGRLQERPFEYVPWAPAGAMSVSGEDMGRFMMAHLNGGVLDGARILQTGTAVAMRGKLTSFSPAINGMLHGFMEMNWNGETIYGHGGDTLWFHSLTAMFPARNLGVFVAYNTNTGGRAVQEFFQAFVDHYFPSLLAHEPAASPETRDRLQRFAGTYASSRVSESDFTKLTKLLAPLSIAVDANGYLVTRSGGDVNRWRPVEPLVFDQVDGHRRLVFRENARGQVADVCASPICNVVMIKQPWWKSTVFQLTWSGTCIAILAIAFVGFPIAAIAQRGQPKWFFAMLARLCAWVTSVVFLAGLVAVLVGGRRANEIVFEVPRAMKTGLALFVVGSVLSAVMLAFAVAAWRRSWWHATGRVCLTAVALAAVATAIWLYQWNLLVWNVSL
jgi:CubicO group peptidase (beta-lactamase class C family)